MYNFLFEILSEEIPAGLQKTSSDQFYSLFSQLASDYGVSINQYKTYYSSQRIILKLELDIKEINNIKNIRGPKIDIDEKILEAFLTKNNANKNDLIKIEQGKHTYFAINIVEKFNHNKENILNNLSNLCNSIFRKFTWSKSMTWQQNGDKWIRPIRSILILYNNEIIDCEFGGVKSSNKTYGHKILSFNGESPKEITITDISQYEDALKKEFVIIDHQERLDKILQYTPYNSQIEELVCIAEYPNILECEIPAEFMSLPKELIDYVMIAHQRYIPGEDNKFLVVIDHNNPNDSMRFGYERVLIARLLDAKFFWERFLKASNDELIEKLKIVPIYDSNIYDFNLVIANHLGGGNWHYKLNTWMRDLGTEIIDEYPALRGLLISSFSKDASNIYWGENELYKREKLSQNHDVRKIVFFNNLEKLKFYFIEKNEEPTSSRDPFGLMKSVVNCLYALYHSIKPSEKGFDISLGCVVNEANEPKGFFADVLFQKDELTKTFIGFENQYVGDSIKLEKLKKMKDFFEKNIMAEFISLYEKYLLENNLSTLNVISKQLIEFHFQRFKFLEHKSLSDFIGRMNNFLYYKDYNNEIIQSYKRIAHIYNKKFKDSNFELNKELLVEKQEKEMLSIIEMIGNIIKSNFSESVKIADILKNKSSDISKIINDFLDNIRIEIDDKAVRENRIALIAQFYRVMESLWPFEKFFNIISA